MKVRESESESERERYFVKWRCNLNERKRNCLQPKKVIPGDVILNRELVDCSKWTEINVKLYSNQTGVNGIKFHIVV